MSTSDWPQGVGKARLLVLFLAARIQQQKIATLLLLSSKERKLRLSEVRPTLFDVSSGRILYDLAENSAKLVIGACSLMKMYEQNCDQVVIQVDSSTETKEELQEQGQTYIDGQAVVTQLARNRSQATVIML